ncbi:MAG: glycine zipper 2TM domain-containing protein [Sulfuritalea sp.]|nr:glycine zipper 2TM domain-containing protein [Sulfuritalea sp.]
MEANHAGPIARSPSPTHPLLLAAAASVTVLSLAGAATLAGWLPGPGSATVNPPAQVLAALPPTAIAPSVALPAPVAPQKKTKPAARPIKRETVAVQRTVPEAQEPRAAVSPAPTFVSAKPVPPICRDCGVVEAVHEVLVQPKGSGGGAVAGGVVGGILGNQIGKGATRDIATIIGAVGGAFAGNHIEKSSKESKRYDVVVRFEDGSNRTFSSESRPDWQSGDRVRLQNGQLTNAGGNAGSNVAI